MMVAAWCQKLCAIFRKNREKREWFKWTFEHFLLFGDSVQELGSRKLFSGREPDQAFLGPEGVKITKSLC